MVMKKLSLFLLTVLLATSSMAKHIYIENEIIEPECPRTEEYGSMFQNDSIWIGFGVDEYSCRVSIKNNTNERVYVEWSNFRWDSSPIVFDTDSRLFMNTKKEDEVIMPGEWLGQNIIQKSLVGESWITPWIDVKYLKKGGFAKSRLIVPIRYSSGVVKDYIFVIKAYNSDDNNK